MRDTVASTMYTGVMIMMGPSGPGGAKVAQQHDLNWQIVRNSRRYLSTADIYSKDGN